MHGAIAQLSLIYPTSGTGPDAAVCSALAWPAQNALLKAPTGITVDLLVWPVVKEEGEIPEDPVPAKVLECLRFSIQRRVEHLNHPAIQYEMRATVDSPSTRWLRLVAQGYNKEGVMTLTVNIQHHLAYQALGVALLHPPRDGFKVYQEAVWYSVRLAESTRLMQLLAQPRPKKKAGVPMPPPPSETALIVRSFTEGAFRGAETKGATFAPHLPKPSKTRWYVAAEDPGRNPLVAPSPAAEMWPEGTCVYTPTDGRFALTLATGAQARTPAYDRITAPKTPKWRDTGPDGEELWVMVDELRK